MVAVDMGGPVNKVAFLMGLIGITEGAIPFASADPKRVLPSIIIGSAVAGVLYSFLKKDLKTA